MTDHDGPASQRPGISRTTRDVLDNVELLLAIGAECNRSIALTLATLPADRRSDV